MRRLAFGQPADRNVGAPSFLLLSLLFALHHVVYSTLRLVLKNTILAPAISILSFLSPFISGSLIVLTLHFHLHPPSSGNSLFPTLTHVLVDVLPYLYASILRWVSPLFTLLEGICTLLVIQVVGRAGKGWADEEEKEEGVEWRSLLGLVFAALVYCAGLAGVVMVIYKSYHTCADLFQSFPSVTFPAFLLGAALASVLFLSLIGFTLRRTNVPGNESCVCLHSCESLGYSLQPRSELMSRSIRHGCQESKPRWSEPHSGGVALILPVLDNTGKVGSLHLPPGTRTP